MPLFLGVDTGGTYTDAVLIRDEKTVLASAKALTTRQNLSIGIGEAVEAVLKASDVAASEIGLASLSTTLATNALVEGQGGRIGLVYIGFRDRDLESHGLNDALAGDPVIALSGGHNHAGSETVALDTDRLSEWLNNNSNVSAFAVASQFATRNPAHELAAAKIIGQITGKSVSCSHHLSAKLNGPKRALTALLNARLIGMIARLIEKAESSLVQLGVNAPLMVVRGDGALISAEFAKERPIETILSGPAASLVGARWLTQAQTALVSDIGGTTTDVAVLRDGKPKIDPAGAQVGPWRTMVEAVAMRTTGLGGDSEVHILDEGLVGGIILGPRRVVPVSLIATVAPDVVHAALDKQLRSETPGEYDAQFLRPVSGMDRDGLGSKEMALIDRIDDGVQPLGQVLKSRMDGSILRRLVNRGLVQVSGPTPSDASHVLERLEDWDRDAAEKAMLLVGRKRTGSGNMLCADASAMANLIVDQLTHQTSLALLDTAFAEEAFDFGLPTDVLSRHILMQRGLLGHQGLVRLNSGLNLPVVGLGASAFSYYPAVGDRLGCNMILPDHAGVANAIGAVVGQVTIRKQGVVTSPSEGRYRVHLDVGPKDHTDEDSAMAFLCNVLELEARQDAQTAGAQDIQVSVSKDVKKAKVEAREVFVEATVIVEASGRPRIVE